MGLSSYSDDELRDELKRRRELRKNNDQYVIEQYLKEWFFHLDHIGVRSIGDRTILSGPLIQYSIPKLVNNTNDDEGINGHIITKGLNHIIHESLKVSIENYRKRYASDNNKVIVTTCIDEEYIIMHPEMYQRIRHNAYASELFREVVSKYCM